MKTDSMGVSSYTNSNYSLNQVTDSELLDKLDTNRGVKRFLSMKKTEDLRREAIANQTKPQPNGTTPLFFIPPTESTSESSEETFTNTRIQSSCPDTNARVQSTCPDDKTGVFGNFKSYSEYMLRRRPKESDVPAVPSSVSVKSILKGKAEEQKPQPPLELPNSARKAVKFSETVVVQQVDEETCTVNVSNCKVDGNFKLPKEANGFPNRTFVSENSPAPSKLIIWKSNLLLAKEKAAFKNPQPTEESTTSDYESTEEAASCLFPKKHAIDGMENVKQHKDETDAPTCCESDTEADIKGGSGDGYDSSSVSSPNAQSTLCDSVDLMLNQLKVGDAPNACITTGDTQAEAALQPNEQNVVHLSIGSCEEVKTKVSNDGPQNEGLQIEKTQNEKLRNERLQAEKLLAERLQAERLQAERLKAERLKAERLKVERLQAERLQAERVQNQNVQNERMQNEEIPIESIQTEETINEGIQTERMHNDTVHNDRMNMERISVDRMQTDTLHSEKIPKEGIQTERLHKEGIPKEGTQTEMLHNERIPKEGIQTERLRNNNLHSEGTQNERMQNERINDEGLRNERILHERMLIEKLQNEMMQNERMRNERMQNKRMRNERMYNEKLKNEMEQEIRIPNELRNSESVSDMPNPHALKASPREQHLAAIYRESEDENFSGTQSDEMETLFKRTLRTNSVPSLDIIQGQMLQQCIVQRAVRSNYKIYTPRRRSRSASRQRFYRKPISPREQPDISIKKKKFDDFNWIKVFAIIVTIVLLLVAVLSFRKEIVDVGQQFAEKIKWLWLQRLKPQPKKIETKQPFYAALRKWMPF